MQELAKSISELVNSLNGGAKGLAEAMQRVAPDAWRIAVRQVVIDSWTSWACWLLFCALVIPLIRILAKWGSDKKVDEELRGMCWCGAVVLVLFAGVSALVSTSTYLPRILNPQYEAASQLSALFLGK